MGDSALLQNIWEQGAVVGRSLSLAIALPDWLLQAERMVLLACGSSRHAGLVGQNWFETLAQRSTRVLDAAAFGDRLEFSSLPILEPNTVCIALSQSGQTKDVLEAIAQLRAVYPDLPVLGITNVADSTLVQIADHALITPAGVEGAVAATKSFTAQLVLLARIAIALSTVHAIDDQSALKDQLLGLPKAIESTLKLLQQQGLGQGKPQLWMDAKSMVILGSAVQSAIALEGALKLKETCYVHAEGFGTGDFLHGPMAILDSAIPVLSVLPSPTFRSQLDRFKAWGSPIIEIIPENAAKHPTDSPQHQSITIKSVSGWLMPFLTVLPFQLLAYDWATYKNLNVDRPRHLTKFIS